MPRTITYFWVYVVVTAVGLFYSSKTVRTAAERGAGHHWSEGRLEVSAETTPRKKNIGLVMLSLVSGIACMPVAVFVHTAAGLALASASVWAIYAAG